MNQNSEKTQFKSENYVLVATVAMHMSPLLMSPLSHDFLMMLFITIALELLGSTYLY